MMEESTDDTLSTTGWRRLSPEAISAPIVQCVPYFELKLEHPDLEPDGHSGRFYPDAVPYSLGDVPRVFYWRPSLAPPTDDPEGWELACATTHELVGFDSLPADGPSLVTEGASGTILVAGGTIAGEARTNHVESYAAPHISIESQSATEIRLSVDGADYSVSTGGRRRITLHERSIRPVEEDCEPTTVAPELVVRFPGGRELHHPARGSTYRLFPSFGLDLAAVPNPVPVPTSGEELDDAALATELGIDLSQRPYPERVLWQAFAYTAFDPHDDVTPEITQLETNHIVLRSGNGRT